MAKSLYEPTQAELDEARRHIMYEVRMLRAAVRFRMYGGLCADDVYLGSALSDSVLLHARNLYKFLTDSRRSDDDVVAAHYVGDGDRSWESPDMPVMRSCIGDINKTRAHLTYSRNLIERTWPYREMLAEVESGFAHLLGYLPVEQHRFWQA